MLAGQAGRAGRNRIHVRVRALVRALVLLPVSALVAVGALVVVDAQPCIMLPLIDILRVGLESQGPGQFSYVYTYVPSILIPIPTW